MERKKGLTCDDQGDLRKCKVWAPHSCEELRVSKGSRWVMCDLLK
jgi:hypothetical protein